MYTLRYTPQSKLTSLEPKTMMTVAACLPIKCSAV